ncbi:AAA family ATPase [Providencia manganoxydans]|uniref:AAA family ATPase n=1 Tax=Providencia manganoxydans TaxID=2923283 RepID=UPI0034E596E2
MELRISNYKSIVDQVSVKVDGLTILSGANSSGKSSFIQPFLIIKQTKDASFSPEGLVLSGDSIQLSDSTDIVPINNKNKNKLFTVSILDENYEEHVSFIKKRDEGIVPYDIYLNGDFYKINEKFGSYSQVSYENRTNLEPIYSNGKKNGSLNINDVQVLSSEGVDFFYSIKSHKNSTVEKYKNRIANKISVIGHDIIHIPGVRNITKRNLTITSGENQWMEGYKGSFEVYIPGIIYKWQRSGNKKLNILIENLKKLSLTSNIKVNRKNDTIFEIMVSRNMFAQDSFVNIMDVGIGVSHVLPILVAGLVAKKNNIIYIEQPELHLHPKAQEILADIIIENINNGCKYLIETHSSIFIRRVQTLIALKKINKDKVSMNWFSINEKGNTLVESADIHADGSFGDWPANFESTYLNADDDYINAVANLLGFNDDSI